MQVHAFQGHPCSCSHCNTSRCPPCAALLQVDASQGHPCSWAHCRISKCPPYAAYMPVDAPQGHPCSWAHCNTERCPCFAAALHTDLFHGHPLSLAHSNRLTDPTTERSWSFGDCFAHSCCCCCGEVPQMSFHHVQQHRAAMGWESPVNDRMCWVSSTGTVSMRDPWGASLVKPPPLASIGGFLCFASDKMGSAIWGLPQNQQPNRTTFSVSTGIPQHG